MTDEKSRLQELINQTHKHGVEIAAKMAEALRLKQGLERLNAERRKHLKQLQEKTTPTDFTMYDTITVGTVPSTPQAVAGYVDGKWPTFNELVRRFPRAKHLSIAVFPSDDADCLDIEAGDATPDQAGPWAQRQKQRGKRRCILYFSVSNKSAVEASLAQHGIRRSEVKFWGAHYTYQPHLEPGFDAIQWTDRALNKNLDASLCKGDFI